MDVLGYALFSEPPYQRFTLFQDCTHVRLFCTHFRLIMAASMACQAVAKGLRGASASCLFLNKNKVMLNYFLFSL